MKSRKTHSATSQSTASEQEFYPTPESLRRVKIIESVIIFIATLIMCVAVSLTNDFHMFLFGLGGVVIVGVILLYQFHVMRKASDPVWLAKSAVRVQMDASRLLVIWGDRAPQQATWSELDDCWQSRLGIIVSRRDRGSDIRIVQDYFTIAERRSIIREVRERIAAAAPPEKKI